MAPQPQDRPDVQVFTEIGIIEHLMRVNIIRHLPEGMTYTHFELLLHFSRTGDGDTPAQIADAVQMTKGAITNALQRMQAMGLVAVLADVSDRRKKRVRITRGGVEMMGEVLKRMKPQTDALREGFTETEFRQALPFLRALRSFLDEVRSDVVEPGTRPAGA